MQRKIWSKNGTSVFQRMIFLFYFFTLYITDITLKVHEKGFFLEGF